MQISDLVAIGKLGNRIDENGFIPFTENKYFEIELLKDVFLIFKDNRVRYVTVIETLKDKVLRIKFDDKISAEEAVNAGNVKIAVSKDDLFETVDSEVNHRLLGNRVIFEDNHIGEIIDVFSNTAQEILVVKPKTGKTIMIPHVDHFIKAITDDLVITQNISELLEL